MDFRQAASILCQAERPDLADPVIGTEFSFAAERVVYKGVVRQQPDQRRKMPFRIFAGHGDEARQAVLYGPFQRFWGVRHCFLAVKRLQPADL